LIFKEIVMKTTLLVSLAALLLPVAVLAEDRTIEHGDGIILPDGAATLRQTKDLKAVLQDAWACIEMDEPLYSEVEKWLYKNKQRRFIRPGHRCWEPGRVVVIYSFGQPGSVPFDGNGNYNNFGRRSSFSESISQQGSEWAIAAFATLIDANGHGGDLGQGVGTAFAGSSQSNSASFGIHFGSSSSIRTTIPSQVATTIAARRAIKALIKAQWQGWSWVPFVGDPNASYAWNIGAAQEVRNAVTNARRNP
jgi:hypothetical protein